MVECARLESVYAARYRGFESLTLRTQQGFEGKHVMLQFVVLSVDYLL